jgi:hypothetical protein
MVTIAIPFNPLLETPTSQAQPRVINHNPQVVFNGFMMDSIMVQRNEKRGEGQSGGESRGRRAWGRGHGAWSKEQRVWRVELGEMVEGFRVLVLSYISNL